MGKYWQDPNLAKLLTNQAPNPSLYSAVSQFYNPPIFNLWLISTPTHSLGVCIITICPPSHHNLLV